MFNLLAAYASSSTSALENSSAPASFGIFIVYSIFICIGLSIGLVFFILQGIGMLKMHQKLGLSGGWMSFVPVLSFYAFGKIAQQYVMKSGKESAKFSIILLVLNLISGFLAVSSYIFVLLGIMLAKFAAIMLIIYFSLIFLALGLKFVADIISYVALWRIFAIFKSNNATLFLILSLLFSVAQPIIIFAIRNSEPENIKIQLQESFIDEEITVV